MFCTNCGQKRNGNNRFCSNCGQEFKTVKNDETKNAIVENANKSNYNNSEVEFNPRKEANEAKKIEMNEPKIVEKVEEEFKDVDQTKQVEPSRNVQANLAKENFDNANNKKSKVLPLSILIIVILIFVGVFIKFDYIKEKASGIIGGTKNEQNTELTEKNTSTENKNSKDIKESTPKENPSSEDVKTSDEGNESPNEEMEERLFYIGANGDTYMWNTSQRMNYTEGYVDINHDGVDEKIKLGYDTPNGMIAMISSGNYGYNLAFDACIPSEINSGFDDLADGGIMQLSTVDFDYDGIDEIVLAYGNSLTSLGMTVFKIHDNAGKFDLEGNIKAIGYIEGQEYAELSNGDTILAPYGSQGLYTTYKVYSDRIVNIDNGTIVSSPYEIRGVESSSDYIIFDSNIRYLNTEEVSVLSKEELSLARNEIFARHGYVFNSEEFVQYFNSKSWYIPNLNFEGSKDELNEYEEYNIELIQEWEKRK